MVLLVSYFSLLILLSSSGVQVSRLGFGCAGLSGLLNNPLSVEEGCSIIKEAISRGITFFDTANIYGKDHHNEIMVGKVRLCILFFFPNFASVSQRIHP